MSGLPDMVAADLLGYIDGSLDPFAAGRLRAWLDADPAHPGLAREWIAAQHVIHRAARASDSGVEADRLVRLARLRRDSRRQVNLKRILARTSRRRPRRPLLLWLGAAAAALLAALLVLLPGAPRTATWQADGIAARPIRIGERIQAGDGGVLRLRDGSQVRLAVDAVCRLADERTVLADLGGFTITAAAQAPGSRLRFETPHGAAEVVGTRFGLAVTRDGTRVQVEEGRVAVSDRAEGRWLLGPGEARTIGLAEAPAVAAADLVPRQYTGPSPLWRELGSERLPWQGEMGEFRLATKAEWHGAAIWTAEAVADGSELSVEAMLPAAGEGGKWIVALSASPAPLQWERPDDPEFEPVVFRRLQVMSDGTGLCASDDPARELRQVTPVSLPRMAGGWTRLAVRLAQGRLQASGGGAELGSLAVPTGRWHLGLRVAARSVDGADGVAVRIPLRNLRCTSR